MFMVNVICTLWTFNHQLRHDKFVYNLLRPIYPKHYEVTKVQVE